MKLNKYEKAELEAALARMNKRQKASYIFTYYKWQILLGLIAVFILISAIHRELTRKNDVLFVGMANVSIGEDVRTELTDDYLSARGINLKKNQVRLYGDWYLSNDAAADNHQYAYASRMKIMAAIEAGQLDVLFMNQEAYDILSRNEYLLPLESLPEEFTPYLVKNEVIVEDNSIEYDLNEADELRIITKEVVNGFDMSECTLFQDAEFSGSVYAAVIANTERLDEVTEYFRYLFES